MYGRRLSVACRYMILVLLCFTIPTGASFHQHADGVKVRRRHSRASASRQQPAFPEEALVYARSDGLVGQVPQNSSVELMRFVTAYRTGIEAVVDITPYSQLLRAAAKRGKLSWYTFIDTWVKESMPVNHVLYQNNITGKCFLYNETDGNGWQLNAYLTFWQRGPEQPVSTQPREQVMLSPGYYGGVHRIGEVAMFEGQITDNGNSVLLDKTIDIDPNMNQVEVFGCDGEGSAHYASFIGYIARRAELYTLHGNPAGVDMVTDELFGTLVYEHLREISVTSVDNASLVVNGTYNASLLTLEPGMPVFLNQVFTDANISGVWLNTSVPLYKIGNVSFVSDDGNVSLQMNKSVAACLPSAQFAGLPGLLVPTSPDAINRTRALVHAAKNWGIAAANQTLQNISASSTEKMLRSTRGSQMYMLKPHLNSLDSEQALDLEEPEHHNGTVSLASLPMVGKVDISAKPQVVNGSKSHLPLLQNSLLGSDRSDGQKVCAVAQKQHGHLFSKKFNLSTLEPSDRVIYQLAITGHGWASTTEQCGEYCHAVYRLSLNGKSAANVTQFRDDCKKNPINGSLQYGTWDEPRNGWCPGSVEPGLFMDLTEHSQRGENLLSVNVAVWSNSTLSYEPFTDYGGFVFDDAAFLTVGSSVFIYDRSAVEAIKQQPKAYTAAEAAIRQGSSHPSSLRPPEFVAEPLQPEALLQLESKSREKSIEPHRAIGNHVPADGHPGRPSLLRSEFKIEARERREAAGVDIVASADIGVGSLWKASREGELSKTRRNGTGAQQDNTDKPTDRYDFEATAPWYLYNSTEGDPLQGAGTTRVTLYNQLLVTSGNRENYMSITQDSLPSDWSHVALHFQLSKPPHLDYDHWDREGSFGLRLR